MSGPANLYAHRQRLANLWARGAALQCCFTQEKIDFLLVVYHGSVEPGSIFDPSLHSVVAGQAKYRGAGDKNAELAISPIGVVRNRDNPLPYLAILMELGAEASFKENGKKIKCTASNPPADGEFGPLCDALDKAARNLVTYQRGENIDKDILKDLKKEVNNARLAVDSCNRYSISVRGASPNEYGILREAKIAKEFATLLSIVMPSRTTEHSTRKHMRPLESLLNESHHNDWMLRYGVSNEGWKP